MRRVPGSAWLAAVAGVLALGTAPATAQITYRPIESDPVRVESGAVSGTWLPSGVKAWLGVPFAAPPVRELRWREPQPAQPWPGVWTANRFQPKCMQALRAATTNHYAGEEATSEDCLYLNIWAPPAARAGAKLPVVVWIYGGGFNIGSASQPLYRGEALAKKGVIYIGVEYRVGVLGFLAHPELTAESGHNASGNYGFLDQVAALRWVQRNIDRFGGDPGNVTLVGQSAGSMSISNLQASPLARGLFHKAVGMAGSTVVPGMLAPGPRGAAEQEGVKLQKAMQLGSVAEMRNVAADRVLAAATAAGVRTGQVVDGWFLPRPPREIFAAGEANDVALLVGATADDIGTRTSVRQAATLEGYRTAAREAYGDKADAFLRLFPAASDAEARAAGAEAGMASGMFLANREWARLQAQPGRKPAYLWRFSRVHPYLPGVTFPDHDPKTVGAYHTAEVPYWLQTQDALNLFRKTRGWTPWDRELADRMSDVLVAFARTGDPSTPAVRVPRYDPRNELFIEFGDSIRIGRLNTPGIDFLAVTPAAPTGAPPARPPADTGPRY